MHYTAVPGTGAGPDGVGEVNGDRSELVSPFGDVGDDLVLFFVSLRTADT